MSKNEFSLYLMGALFITLKLTGDVDFPWWVINAPLGAGLVLFVFGLLTNKYAINYNNPLD